MWASSEGSRHELRRMLLRVGGEASSLDLIWATFGSGKKLTLFYLEDELGKYNAPGSKSTCVYFELNDGAKSFLDLYIAMADALDWSVMILLGWLLPTGPADFRLTYVASPIFIKMEVRLNETWPFGG